MIADLPNSLAIAKQRSVDRKTLERSTSRTPIDEGSGGGNRLSSWTGRILLRELHETIRLRIGQRFEKDGIHHRKHSGVSADAQSERCGRARDKQRRSAQQAQDIATVRQHRSLFREFRVLV